MESRSSVSKSVNLACTQMCPIVNKHLDAQLTHSYSSQKTIRVAWEDPCKYNDGHVQWSSYITSSSSSFSSLSKVCRQIGVCLALDNWSWNQRSFRAISSHLFACDENLLDMPRRKRLQTTTSLMQNHLNPNQRVTSSIHYTCIRERSYAPFKFRFEDSRQLT